MTPGQFMAEDGGRHNHFGVIAAFENFQIGAAGERGLDADADFAGFQRWRRDVFDLNFFPAVKDGGFHGRSIWPRTDRRKKSFVSRVLISRRPTLPDQDPDLRGERRKSVLGHEIRSKAQLRLGAL